jgi:hypothetical protein
MRSILDTMRSLKAEIRQYPGFYSLMIIGCPILYTLLLWLDNWGNTPIGS